MARPNRNRPRGTVGAGGLCKLLGGSQGLLRTPRGLGLHLRKRPARPPPRPPKSGREALLAPDQHLCANTLRELGYPPEALALWHRDLPQGGLTPEAIRRARAIAWDGCCPIHAGYTVNDVALARAEWPHATLLIHPEAPSRVAFQADHTGSTKAIIEAIARAEQGQRFIVGTEQHLVARLTQTYPTLDIHPLRPILCEDMGRTTPQQLLHVLQEWPEACLVRLPDAIIPDARVCVERMLAL